MNEAEEIVSSSSPMARELGVESPQTLPFFCLWPDIGGQLDTSLVDLLEACFAEYILVIGGDVDLIAPSSW